MSSKKIDVSRRSFVRRAGLLVSSLGVGASVQSGLLDAIVRKANRKWGVGEAMAAEPGVVNYAVEICLRAGFQFNCLFPSQGHLADTHNAALNFYSTNQNVLAYQSPGSGARPVYFSKFVAGQGGERLMNTIAAINGGGERIGVATSEAIRLQTAQHTASFSSRAPTTNTPAPAVLHAALAPETAVRGVVFDGGRVDHQNAGLPEIDGTTVRTREQFRSLYRDLPMYFTFDELKLVLGEIENGAVKPGSAIGGGAIGSLDQLFLAKNIKGTDSVAQVSLSGRGQSLLQIGAALDATYASIAPNFPNIDQGYPNFDIQSPKTFLGYTGSVALGSALASSLSGFANGALNTAVVTMESQDWHGAIYAKNDPESRQAKWNVYLGDALAGFLASAAQLDDPLAPGKKIIDSLLISLSSEFTRTPNRNGSGAGNDNGDGGSQAFAFLGSKVRSGSLGNITGAGQVVGFDPSNGQPGGVTQVTEGMVWKTAGRLMGVSESTLAGYMNGPSIGAIVK